MYTAIQNFVKRHTSITFFIFKMAVFRNLRFSNFWLSIGLKRLMCIAIQISSKSAKWFWGYRNFSIFNMAAVHHFGFVGQILGRPKTRIWWLFIHYCAKLGWNRISHFDNSKVWMFCTFGLKCIFTPLFGCFRGKIGENGNFMHCYPSRNGIT